jgi:hypothetical protein
MFPEIIFSTSKTHEKFGKHEKVGHHNKKNAD